MIAKDKMTTNKQSISGPAALWRCDVLLLPRFFQATVTSSILINQVTKKIHFLYSKHEAILSSNDVIPPKTEICLEQEIYCTRRFLEAYVNLKLRFLPIDMHLYT
jgi:hypothetical protein